MCTVFIINIMTVSINNHLADVRYPEISFCLDLPRNFKLS